MGFHGDILEDCGIHIINAWSYADATDRGTHTPSDGSTAALDTDDIGKVSHQLSDNTFWVLIDDFPITWSEITNSTVITTLQVAYVAGNTITTSAPEGNVDISGSEDLIVTLSDVDMDVSGTITLDATTSITIGGDADTSDINIGTSTSVRDITIGNATGATGVTIDSGTERVEINDITHYGAGAGNPIATTSGFQDGDHYWDTGLSMEMRYDSTRAKWLSVESATFMFGRNNNVPAGVFYRGINGKILSSTIGFLGIYDGTVVSLAYTRDDSDLATFEVTASGSTITSLASSAISGSDLTTNDNFSQNDVLGVRNAIGSNTTSDVQGWVRIKWRA